MDDFPPNSKAAHAGAPPNQPRVERVTSAVADRRKTPLGQRVKNTFFAGDGKTTRQFVMLEVVVPAVQDLFLEIIQSGIEHLVLGESRRGRGPKTPTQSVMGNFQYSSPTTPYHNMHKGPPSPTLSKRARASHDFDEIVIPNRPEADDVIEQMFAVLQQHEYVTVADLYIMVGIKPTHVDVNWGWTNLNGSGLRRLRDGGYVLNLPEPQPLR